MPVRTGADKMKIEAKKIRYEDEQESLHLIISTPDRDCHNFIIPKSEKDTNSDYSYVFSYNMMKELHKMLDKFINKNKDDS